MLQVISAALIAAAIGQTYEVRTARPRQRYVVTVGQLSPKESAYDAAYSAALAAGQPLLVGVGCDPPKWEWGRVRVERLEGYAAPSLILAVPHQGVMQSIGTLDLDVTAEQARMVWLAWSERERRKAQPETLSDRVRNWGASMTPTPAPRTLQPAEVRRAPFPDAAPTVDADDAPGGRWAQPRLSPQSWEWTDADVPEYMTEYRPAKYTQEIAVTNGRDRISPVPRSRLEAKWQVPGGLVGVRGWSNRLFSWAPRTVTIDNIPVRNSFGYFQLNRGYKVSYEPGTEFLDVLTNTESGKVFEVRKAMKTEAGWQRFVTYRNPAERPRGYHGPKGLDCRGCHSEAGTGGYGTGLVPGGDTVLSAPFPTLEGVQ